MTQLDPVMPASRRDAWKVGVVVLLRVTASVVVLFGAYFIIPTRSAGQGSDVPWLILDLCVFGAVVGVQLPAIINAKRPIIRALEALAILVPLYLLLFARLYLSNSLNDPATFNQPLDNITALYFTVTVFATVGFGDIVPITDGMRMLVTVQMLLNLVVLGVVIRLITSAARRGMAKKGGPTDLGESNPPLG